LYTTFGIIEFGFLNSARKKSWSETNRLSSLQQLLLVRVQEDKGAAPVQLVPSLPPVTLHSRTQQMISEYLLTDLRK
jgi:hypothetical protein